MYPNSRNQPSDLTFEVIFKVKLADKAKIVKISNFHGRAMDLFPYAENVHYNIALQSDMHQSLASKLSLCANCINNQSQFT